MSNFTPVIVHDRSAPTCKCQILSLETARKRYAADAARDVCIDLYRDCPQHGREARPALWRGVGPVKVRSVTAALWHGLDALTRGNK